MGGDTLDEKPQSKGKKLTVDRAGNGMEATASAWPKKKLLPVAVFEEIDHYFCEKSTESDGFKIHVLVAIVGTTIQNQQTEKILFPFMVAFTRKH